MTWLRRIGPGPLLFVGLWLLLMVGGRSRFFRDPGTFWHTRTGELILAGGFFETDPYSFTRTGERWVPHQWLGEVGLALTHRVAGFDSLLLLAVTAIAALYTWLTLRLLRTGAHAVLVVPVAALGLAAGATHFHVRPHLATIVGLAVTAAVLADVDSGRARLRRLWLLVPVYLAWANTHGGMLGGVASLVLVGIGWAAARVAGWPSPFAGWRDGLEYAAVVGACALSAVVTPYGADVPKVWVSIMSLGDLSRFVEEHAPLRLSDAGSWPVAALAGVYVFMLVGLRQKPRVTWLLPIFWLIQAYGRVRHAPLFGVVALAVIAEMWPATVWARALAACRPDLYDPTTPPRTAAAGWLLPVALVILTIAFQASGVKIPVVGAGWARLDPDRWPVDLLEVVRATRPTGSKTLHVFNECEFGGFLIYHAPAYRVFFDDRFELYGAEMVREFVLAGAEDTPRRMADWQARYGPFDSALVRPGGGFDEFFGSRTDEWERVATGKTANFYLRRRIPAADPGNANGPR